MELTVEEVLVWRTLLRFAGKEVQESEIRKIAQQTLGEKGKRGDEAIAFAGKLIEENGYGVMRGLIANGEYEVDN